MTCYSPVTLYKSRQGRSRETGKWPLVSLKDGYRDLPVEVPCGRCIGCRLERSRQWAIRCMCEAQMHNDSCFITLTYDNQCLNVGKYGIPTLVPRDLELFWKRFRKEAKGAIRYFACGEYGERFGRPHYHAIVFGHSFSDKTFCRARSGNHGFRSNTLSRLWPFGDNFIGDVTFESAAYVARYIVDKRLGQQADLYTRLDFEPEFVRMSRRPGLGSLWFDKYSTDVFPNDYMVIRNGVKVKPPKYYGHKFELDNPVEYKLILERRKLDSYANWRDRTPERLRVRERVKLAQVSSLRR